MDWKEANSEPSASVGKLLYELNEKECFPIKSGEKG